MLPESSIFRRFLLVDQRIDRRILASINLFYARKTLSGRLNRILNDANWLVQEYSGMSSSFSMPLYRLLTFARPTNLISLPLSRPGSDTSAFDALRIPVEFNGTIALRVDCRTTSRR